MSALTLSKLVPSGMVSLTGSMSSSRARFFIVWVRAMLTQEQLAEKSGVGVTTINRIEKGRVGDPHFSTLRKLARACGVDPVELIRGD
jgi:DNA-binding XRE family transcriptional regulator